MKNLLKFTFLTFILLLIYPLLISSALLDTNLITNPGFENDSARLINWTLVTYNRNTPSWDIVAHSGERSVRVEIGGTKDKISGDLRSDLIIAEPVSKYTLSAWGKSKNSGGTNAPAVRAVELDANKNFIGQTNLVFNKGTNNWAQKTINFQTGPRTAYLYTYANIFNGYGTFWVDDVRLYQQITPMPTSTPTPTPEPTPTPAHVQALDYREANISIAQNNLEIFKFNWNGTNYSFYDSSLVLAMNFNNNPLIGETATKAVDISKYGNDGTINGATWTTDGRFRGALQFDGNDDHVEIASNPSLNIINNITVEAWVKWNRYTNYDTIVSKGDWADAYTLYLRPDNSLTWYTQGTSPYAMISNAKIPFGMWTQIVTTYDGSTKSIYINGDLDYSERTTGTITSSSKALRIGEDFSYENFNGAIDELRIWNRSLSLNEIRMHYRSEFQKYNSTEWRFYDNVSMSNGTEKQVGYLTNKTGWPVGGGTGYPDIVLSNASVDYYIQNNASNRTYFLSALERAISGDIIYINDNVRMDLTLDHDIIIPAGVTIASGRGNGSSQGALLFNNNIKLTGGTEEKFYLFTTGGSGARITGIRLQGPDNETRNSAYEYSIASGIYSEYYIEVDNSELYNWSQCAICLYFVPQSATPYIHHNYIHDNRRAGLGYGISHAEGSNSLIESNIFDWNRHSIAGDGTINTGYIARYNLVYGNGNSFSFDMHGGADRQDGTDIAGKTILIYGNTFHNIAGYPAVQIRGIPTDKVEIYNNYGYYDNENSAFKQTNALGNMKVYNNCYNGSADYLLDGTYTYYGLASDIFGNSNLAGIGAFTVYNPTLSKFYSKISNNQ